MLHWTLCSQVSNSRKRLLCFCLFGVSVYLLLVYLSFFGKPDQTVRVSFERSQNGRILIVTPNSLSALQSSWYFHSPMPGLLFSKFLDVFRPIVRHFSNTTLDGLADDVLQRCDFFLSGRIKPAIKAKYVDPRKYCFYQLEQYVKLEGVPTDVISSPNLNKSFEENNANYILPTYYRLAGNESVKTKAGITSCIKKKLPQRKVLYQLLQYWITLAHDHQILWWIACGTMLGSWRDKNMIPYDSDMDVAIFSSDENKLRALATPRSRMRDDEFNLIVRPGEYCPSGPGERISCDNRWVRTQEDTCAFCGPLARLMRNKQVFMDVFLVHLELRLDEKHGIVELGLLDESNDAKFVPDPHLVFPLKSSKIMNLTVPMPRNPERLLELLYGRDFRVPERKCDPLKGEWIWSN
ncbi:hypothetical protein PHET_01904 [Paragonimus heterotremus]|uniref:LicD/FKTN/FKRP nucleotidyltransferase domain-containing protein n=1 Tax=Paragonimus heterotremus TaxID=100268 RepID=A0A8J4WL01_9TREM|nr:hypothetical protein PHET_01904 [Paragonimus heterotremus]